MGPSHSRFTAFSCSELDPLQVGILYTVPAMSTNVLVAAGAAAVVAAIGVHYWHTRKWTAESVQAIIGKRAVKAGTQVFCLNVKIVLKPERRAEFLEIILADRDGTNRDEAGALAFLVGEDTTTENVFYLHEEYIGKAGFDAHLISPHFAPWKKFCETDPFKEAPQVQFYNRIL